MAITCFEFRFVKPDYPGPRDKRRRWTRYQVGAVVPGGGEIPQGTDGPTHVISFDLHQQWARILEEVAAGRELVDPNNPRTRYARDCAWTPERTMLVRINMEAMQESVPRRRPAERKPRGNGAA